MSDKRITEEGRRRGVGEGCDPIRDPHAGIDLDRLQRFFDARVPGAKGAKLRAELIAGGRSNLTYDITDGEHRWVVRRPPIGHLLPSAHDMGREYRVLTALAGSDVPVPPTIAYSDDLGVIGAPFYVMQRVEGRVLRTAADVAALRPAQVVACAHEVIDVLARIHAVDFTGVGLGGVGRPDGYLERQVGRWGEQWERSKTRELPAVDELGRRLGATIPRSGPAALVHGDYRLGNTMLDLDNAGVVVAALDWEMATLGDPLADVGLFLMYWGGGVDPNAPPLDPRKGFLTCAEIVDRYTSVTGRDLDQIDFYVALAGHKLALISEGIHARYLMGETVGPGFDSMGATVEHIIDRALTWNAS